MRRRDQLEEESDEEDTERYDHARAERGVGELARGAPARRREQGGEPALRLLLFAGLLCDAAEGSNLREKSRISPSASVTLARPLVRIFLACWTLGGQTSIQARCGSSHKSIACNQPLPVHRCALI